MWARTKLIGYVGKNVMPEETEAAAVHRVERLGARQTRALVQGLSEGDRVALDLGDRDGTPQWKHRTVTEAGEDYAVLAGFTDYRLETVGETDTPAYKQSDRQRYSYDGAVLLEEEGDEWVVHDYSDHLNGLEVVPEEEISERKWYSWEVGVSEVRGGGVSTDVTVEPEAPTQEMAHQRAKRMARMESGYVAVSYKGDLVDVKDEN